MNVIQLVALAGAVGMCAAYFLGFLEGRRHGR